MNTVNPPQNRILIVDDSGPFRLMLTHLLTDMGFNAVPVENAIRALDVLKVQLSTFSLVITDFEMPCPSGAELIRRIIEFTRTPPPMVLFTGIDLNNHEIQRLRSEIKNHDCVYFLSKTCSFEEFREVLRRAIGKQGTFN